MKTIVEGRIYVPKVKDSVDNIDTDVIIPAGYLTTLDEKELAKHVFEPIGGLPEGTKILVAGLSFGSGSSREHAALALKGFGVKAIVAKSYARIFWKNAINNGIYPFTANTDEIIEYIEENNITGGKIINEKDKYYLVLNDKKFELTPPEGLALEIVEKGGLANFISSIM